MSTYSQRKEVPRRWWRVLSRHATATVDEKTAAPRRGSYRGARGRVCLILVGLLVISSTLPGAVFASEVSDQTFFYVKPPAADFPSPTNQTEAQRQDIEFFRHYLDLNLSFKPAARAEAQRRIEHLGTKAGTLSPAQFELAVAKIVALAGNGHSQVVRLGVLPDGQRYHRFPFLAGLFSEGLCVTRAMSVAQHLIGSCITAIDGVPAAKILSRFRASYGGIDEHFGASASFFYAQLPDFLYAAGITRRPDRAVISYRALDGQTDSQQVEAVAAETFPKSVGIFSALLPVTPAEAAAGWQSVLHLEDRMPLYLKYPDELFVRERLAKAQGFYIQLKINANYQTNSIGSFLDAAMKEIRELSPRFIVVDFRFNTGGVFTTTGSATKELPTLLPPGGRIYVITNGTTFSAAITSVNVLKQVGGDNTIIVGEPVGDKQRFWAEGAELCLPNSKICIAYARGLHDYARGCDGEFGCYETLVPTAVPLRVTSLNPDIPVRFTLADYANRRDAALDAILAEELRREARNR